MLQEESYFEFEKLHRFLQNIALHAEFWFDCA